MPDNAAILPRNNEEESRFEAEVDGHLAIAEYRLKDGVVVFTHTAVPPELEGKGVGSALAKAALGWARLEHFKVVPRCSFFAAYMKRHDDTQDLLNEEGRALIGR